MKKTFITLLAFSGLVSAATDTVTWTFSNEYKADSPGETPTYSRVYTRAGLQFSLAGSSTSYAVSSSVPDAEITPWLWLDSISLNYLQNANSNMWGILCDSDGHVVALSDTRANNVANQALTFNFSDVRVNVGEKYEIVFFSTTSRTTHDGMLEYLMTENWGIADDSTVKNHSTIAMTAMSTAAATHDGYTRDGLVSYVQDKSPGISPTNLDATLIPAIRIVAHTPEPATATLSLLALAGLAARRKRS